MITSKLNIAKSNFVIFHPHQKKNYLSTCDQDIRQWHANMCSPRVQKLCHVLGVLIDPVHTDSVSIKISKTVGTIDKIRHFVSFNILLTLYKPLILPYLNYGLVAWGRAAKIYTKIQIYKSVCLYLLPLILYQFKWYILTKWQNECMMRLEILFLNHFKIFLKNTREIHVHDTG